MGERGRGGGGFEGLNISWCDAPIYEGEIGGEREGARGGGGGGSKVSISHGAMLPFTKAKLEGEREGERGGGLVSKVSISHLRSMAASYPKNASYPTNFIILHHIWKYRGSFVIPGRTSDHGETGGSFVLPWRLKKGVLYIYIYIA